MDTILTKQDGCTSPRLTAAYRRLLADILSDPAIDDDDLIEFIICWDDLPILTAVELGTVYGRDGTRHGTLSHLGTFPVARDVYDADTLTWRTVTYWDDFREYDADDDRDEYISVRAVRDWARTNITDREG